MVAGFTTSYAFNTYDHKRCELEPCSWRGVLDTTLCDKGGQWLATGGWFSSGTPVSATNETDRNDIAEILLKVTSNTINQPTNQPKWRVSLNSKNQHWYILLLGFLIFLIFRTNPNPSVRYIYFYSKLTVST